MPVFKVFFRILNKRKAALLMYIFIYLVMILFFCNMMEGKGESEFSKVALNIALEDLDQGKLGKTLTEYLSQSHNLQEMPQEKEDLQDAMYYQAIDYVLVIPKDFTEKMMAGETEGLLEETIMPSSRSAYFIENEIEHYLKTLAMYLAADYGIEEAAQRSAKDLSKKPQVGFLEEENGRQLPVGYYFFQYIPYVFVTLMILGVGAAMKTYKDKNLSARNQCSAMPFLKQNMLLLLGCLSYILAVYLLFMLLACVSDREYMFSLKGAFSAANAFVFSLCALSVAWFSVQFVRNVSELSIMSNVFGLGFSFLGGVFVPMELMGDTAKAIGKFVPSYWYVVANDKIQEIGSAEEAYSVYQSFFVVLMFAAAFFSAGLLVSKIKVRE